MKRAIKENQGCYNCTKYNTKNCAVYKENNKTPDQYDWCYAYCKKRG